MPNILIVDDEPNNRKLMILILRQEGWKFFEAENGEEAAEIAFAEFNNPDTDAQFDIMGVGVHVMPYDEWMQTGTVVH